MGHSTAWKPGSAGVDFPSREPSRAQVLSEMNRVPNPHRHPWILSALLMALIVRALVPAGFMPATDRPFSFQICPDGFPAHMLAVANASFAPEDEGEASVHAGHHHHSHPDGASSHEASATPVPDGRTSPEDGTPHRHAAAGMERCTFAAAAGPALLAWTPAFSAPAAVARAPEFVYVVPALKPLRFRVQQARGPPALV